MNAKQKWILGAVAFLLLLVIAGFGYQELQKEAERQAEKQAEADEDAAQEEKEATEYAEAPDFTVWDQDGNQTSLKEILEGKPAVINFWRSEERRVGKECMPQCRSRWSPYH